MTVVITIIVGEKGGSIHHLCFGESQADEELALTLLARAEMGKGNMKKARFVLYCCSYDLLVMLFCECSKDGGWERPASSKLAMPCSLDWGQKCRSPQTLRERESGEIHRGSICEIHRGGSSVEEDRKVGGQRELGNRAGL